MADGSTKLSSTAVDVETGTLLVVDGSINESALSQMFVDWLYVVPL